MLTIPEPHTPVNQRAADLVIAELAGAYREALLTSMHFCGEQEQELERRARTITSLRKQLREAIDKYRALEKGERHEALA